VAISSSVEVVAQPVGHGLHHFHLVLRDVNRQTELNGCTPVLPYTYPTTHGG